MKKDIRLFTSSFRLHPSSFFDTPARHRPNSPPPMKNLIEEDESGPSELLLMRAGGLAFAVRADEAETVVPWSRPARLPGAPPSVLGVVSVRGRMRTVLDPVLLLGACGPAVAGAEASDAEPHFIAPLRGDEQLALAFEHAERFFADSSDLAPAPDAGLPVRGALRRGPEVVYLLDPSKIFDAALRGSDRRRRRSDKVSSEQ
jgi:chemotaxis signal transduction protein